MMTRMPKQIRHQLTYDAPLAEVAAMLRDPGFRTRVCEYQHVLRSSVAIEPDGPGMRVRIEQVQTARGIPSFATKFVGDEIEIVQEETWSGPEQGRLELTFPGKPGDARGTATLAESDGRTVETVDLTVKVSIPLVGGKLEGLIGDLVVKALKAENTVGREWLSAP